MSKSDHAPRGSAGRRLPKRLDDFSEGCSLKPAGKHLVIEIGILVEEHFDSFAGLARHLINRNLDPLPAWARLNGGKQTSAARSAVSKYFGVSAVLPHWGDIEIILRECDAVDRRSEMAWLWTEADGRRPFGYEGDFTDVSEKFELPTGRREADQESSATITALQEEISALRAQIGLRDAEIAKLNEVRSSTEDLINQQRQHLENELKSCGVRVPEHKSSKDPVAVIARNHQLTEKLIAVRTGQGGDFVRRQLGPRLDEAESYASRLQIQLRALQEQNERSAHLAATLLTLAAHPAAVKEWYRPRYFNKLSLPPRITDLFDSLEVSHRPHRRASDRFLAFYLGMFLILSHGTRVELDQDPDGELEGIFEDGTLPSPEVQASFFENREDAARINTLLKFYENDHAGPKRPPRFPSMPAKEHRPGDPGKPSDNERTVLMQAWRTRTPA